jgi:hypothetical protein
MTFFKSEINKIYSKMNKKHFFVIYYFGLISCNSFYDTLLALALNLKEPHTLG